MDSYDVSKESIDRYSLRYKVFSRIREDILDGRYPPGKAIREGKVSQELGVSRTPVREAIRQLELEGLVTVVPNKGAVVSGITAKDIADIYAIRSMIEGLAARWAASQITEEQLQELEENMDLTEFFAKRSNREKLLDLDSRFHEIIYEASNSNPLHHVLSSFHHYVQKARRGSLSTPGRIEQAVEEHQSIVKSLRERQPEQAETMMNLHVHNAARSVLKQNDQQK